MRVNYSIRSFVTAVLSLGLIAVCATAEPSRPSDTIPAADLTREQLNALPNEQVLSSADGEITVGELRRRNQERMAEIEEIGRVSESRSEEVLAVVRRQYFERQITLQEDVNARVDALLAHLRERDARDPEALATARGLAAQRREAHALWLEAQGPLTPAEHRGLEGRLQRLRPVVVQPVD